MNKEQKSKLFKRLRSDEFFDEVIIRQVPRFKTSDMSGDEWRTSARVTLKRKGQTVFERGFGDMSTATAFLPGMFIEVGEMLPNDFLKKWDQRRETECMQPGCANVATHEFRLKNRFCDGIALPQGDMFEHCVRFCDVHSMRGDSDYNDSDENLELISGDPKTIGNIPPDDISKATAFIIDLTEDDDD